MSDTESDESGEYVSEIRDLHQDRIANVTFDNVIPVPCACVKNCSLAAPVD